MLKELLARAVERRASDVHMKPGQVPYFRISGHLSESGFESVSVDSMLNIVADLLPAHLKKPFESEHEADFAHQEESVGRFRVNIYLTQGWPAIALRHVKTEVPTFEELRLPTQLKALADITRGIVLLCGTTGSGKSTTLAAVIGEINRTIRRRIVTVEDPIEYVFEDDQSLITQREVGLDTLSFSNALKHLLRQDPEIILIGEMRDRVSVRTALLAAETGHLVLSSLHASNTELCVSRILDIFPSDEQDQVRLAIAGNLQSIVCQRLIRDLEGNLVPAVEILFNTSTVRKLIEKNELPTLSAAVETGREEGMQTFNQSLYDLISQGIISEEEGLRHATNPEALRMNLQGIFLDQDRRILSS
jgi:twitching motility protein PilT